MAKGEKNYQLGSRIKDIRLREHETQISFAGHLGITQGMLSRYEKGTLPDPEVVLRIVEKYGVSHQWLMTGNGGIDVPPGDSALSYLIDVLKRAFEGMNGVEKDGLVQDVVTIVQRRKVN